MVLCMLGKHLTSGQQSLPHNPSPGTFLFNDVPLVAAMNL